VNTVNNQPKGNGGRRYKKGGRNGRTLKKQEDKEKITEKELEW
jgi:hypothetical protein